MLLAHGHSSRFQRRPKTTQAAFVPLCGRQLCYVVMLQFRPVDHFIKLTYFRLSQIIEANIRLPMAVTCSVWQNSYWFLSRSWDQPWFLTRSWGPPLKHAAKFTAAILHRSALDTCLIKLGEGEFKPFQLISICK
jgi:hypothetical protein